MERRTLWGGSIASFIIVGLIITVVFVGSFYYLRIHGDQVRNDQQIAKNKDATVKQPVQEQTNTDNQTQSSDTVKTDESTSSGSSSQDVIPTTGPELAISELIGAGALTMSSVGYISSRRKFARYL